MTKSLQRIYQKKAFNTKLVLEFISYLPSEVKVETEDSNINQENKLTK